MNISDYFEDEINRLEAIRQELMQVAKCQVNCVTETEKGVKASVHTLAGVVNIIQTLDSHDTKVLMIWRSSGGGGTGEWNIWIDDMS